MHILGAHLSIAGGFHRAIEAAVDMEMQTVQLFTATPSRWQVAAHTTGRGKTKQTTWKPGVLADSAIELFHQSQATAQLQCLVAHDSYLINLATSDDLLWGKSIAAFSEEIRRADALGLDYLVMHPGAHLGEGEEIGLERVVTAFLQILEQLPDFQVNVLVELTAGQGTTLGYRFEHLGTILRGVNDSRFGVCFDTCHALAGGYHWETDADYQTMWDEFDSHVGLEKLKLFHLNDSKKPCGSHVDRHEQIGQGYIGLEPFRKLLQDKRFRKIPMILETPKTNDQKEQMDPVNLRTLRELAGEWDS
ncbi:MAG: deoxyribonuclease IV [Zavarzinella sp.]